MRYNDARAILALVCLGGLTVTLAGCGQAVPDPQSPEEIKAFCSDPQLQKKLEAIKDAHIRETLSGKCFRSGHYTPSKPQAW